jgi:hypothetical protein
MTKWLLAVALAVSACGVRTRPFPPELVQPEPPTALVAASNVDGVRLSWRRPSQYTGGKHMRDLAGFDVERAVGPDSFDFAPVTTVLLDDQTRFRQEKLMQWTDTDVEVGQTYRYRVTAFTSDHYRSAPSTSVSIVHKKVAAARPDETR